jgi:hypothetical protein
VRRLFLWVLAGFMTVSLAACEPEKNVTESPDSAVSASETIPDTVPKDTPTPTKPVAKKPAVKAAPKVATIPGDGTFVVGTEIQPGKYKTAGPSEDSFGMCYWARMKDTDGDFEGIIANGNPAGQTTITIKKTDGAFQSTGCQPWRKVG